MIWTPFSFAFPTYPDQDIFLFEKSDKEGRFLVAVNVRNEQKSIQLPAPWTGQVVTDVMSDQQTTLKETLSLAPYQYLIMKK